MHGVYQSMTMCPHIYMRVMHGLYQSTTMCPTYMSVMHCVCLSDVINQQSPQLHHHNPDEGR